MISYEQEAEARKQITIRKANGEFPPHWSDEDILEYLIAEQHLMTKVEKEEMPDWAKRLDKTLDKLSDMLPIILRMNAERKKEALERARFFSEDDLWTKEEQILFESAKDCKPTDPRVNYPRKSASTTLSKPEKYPYANEEKATTYTFIPREGEGKKEFIERVTSESKLTEDEAEDLWEQEGGSKTKGVRADKMPSKWRDTEDEETLEDDEEKIGAAQKQHDELEKDPYQDMGPEKALREFLEKKAKQGGHQVKRPKSRFEEDEE